MKQEVVKSRVEPPVARVQNLCITSPPIKTQTAKPQDSCPRSLTIKEFLPLKFLTTVYLYAIVSIEDIEHLNNSIIHCNETKVKFSEKTRMKRL